MIFNTLDAATNGRAFLAAIANELRVDPRTLELHTIAGGTPPQPGLMNGLAHMLAWAPAGSAPYVQALVVGSQVPGPWGATLHVVRTAGSFIIGARLIFAAKLQGRIAQNTLLTNGAFAGDPVLSQALNADTTLAWALKGQLRHELVWAKLKLTLPTFASVLPTSDGVTFVVGTMPVVSKFSTGSATFNLAAMIDLAGRVQSHLYALAARRPA
jgi:hypothetical protein